ncbi:methyl-accepting chemotaxis protein [Pontibacter sp. JAM-7]|uniref:methyl-accepting chemotaxis protein n=1 Tax=Pontibacter sp. JAM-7 TaxID=3366581 RepID=UPI003AF796ED
MLIWSAGFTILNRLTLTFAGLLLVAGWCAVAVAAWFQLTLLLWLALPLLYLQLSFNQLCSQRWQKLNQVINAFNDGNLKFRTDYNGSDKPLTESTQHLYSFARNYSVKTQLAEQLCSEMQFSTKELESLANHTAHAAGEQQNQLLTIASASEEMSQTVQQIRDHLSRTHQSAETSQKDSQQGAQKAADLQTTLENLRYQFTDTSNKINWLNTQAESIQSFVTTIETVAAQTNLLALNAAIEAARAGEAGRGFAVVADEVRLLAASTEKATKDITQLVTGMQDGVSQLIDSMTLSETQLGNGAEGCEQMHHLLQQVEEGSNQSLQLIGEVHNAIDEHAMASGELSEKLTVISSLLEQHSAQAKSLTELTHYLENLSVKANIKEAQV